jgi:hypothetical protein
MILLQSLNRYTRYFFAQKLRSIPIDWYPRSITEAPPEKQKRETQAIFTGIDR